MQRRFAQRSFIRCVSVVVGGRWGTSTLMCPLPLCFCCFCCRNVWCLSAQRCALNAKSSHLVDLDSCSVFCEPHWRQCSDPLLRRLYRFRMKRLGKRLKLPKSGGYRCAQCSFLAPTASTMVAHAAECRANDADAANAGAGAGAGAGASAAAGAGAGAGAGAAATAATGAGTTVRTAPAAATNTRAARDDAGSPVRPAASPHVHFSPDPPAVLPARTPASPAPVMTSKPLSAAAARRASGVNTRVVLLCDQTAWEGKPSMDHWSTLHDREGQVPIISPGTHTTFVLVTPGPCESSINVAKEASSASLPPSTMRHDVMIAHLETLRQYVMQLGGIGLAPQFVSMFPPVDDPSKLMDTVQLDRVPAVTRGLVRHALQAVSDNYNLAADPYWRSAEFRATPEVYVLAGLVELLGTLESALASYINFCEPMADVDAIVLPLGGNQYDCQPVVDAIKYAHAVVVDLRTVDVRRGRPRDGLPGAVLDAMSAGGAPIGLLVGGTAPPAAVAKLAALSSQPGAPPAAGTDAGASNGASAAESSTRASATRQRKPSLDRGGPPLFTRVIAMKSDAFETPADCAVPVTAVNGYAELLAAVAELTS